MLSRNKVAVPEGAAGSPPFYGDQNDRKDCFNIQGRNYGNNLEALFNFEGPVAVKAAEGTS